MRSVNVAPSTVMVPPCASATRRASVKPEPEAVAGRARLVAAIERLEDALALFGRDAGAGVLDAERDHLVVARGGELDRRRAVLGGVLDEVPQRALEQRAVGGDDDAVAAGRRARSCPRSRGSCAARSTSCANSCATSTAPRCAGRPRRFQPRRRQHVLDQSIELDQVGLDVAQARLVLGVARQELERDADARQRRAQLVRDVGQQLLLPAHQHLDALGHLVERARQLLELVGRTMTRDGGATARAAASRAPTDRPRRSGAPPRSAARWAPRCAAPAARRRRRR